MSIVVGPSNYVEPYGSGVIPKPVPLHVDANGGLILGAGAVAALLGSVRLQDGTGSALAALAAQSTAYAGAAQGLIVNAGLYGFDVSGGANMVRLVERLANTDMGATDPLIETLTSLAAFDSTAGFPLRLQTLRSVTDGDTGIRSLYVGTQLSNNLTFDRARSASASNLGAFSGLGAALVSEPGEWNISNLPAINVQATATRAGVAGVRHILKSILASLSTSGAAPATASEQEVVVRDGASGAGAILYRGLVSIQAVRGDKDRVPLTGLHIVGTAGNAMTVEFTAAGGANVLEDISASGYDAS